MVLLALDEQDVLVYPAQEEGLGYGVRHLLVPEVLHVLGFEVGDDLVPGVMVLELVGDRGRVVRPDPVQHDGQRMRSDLQELLHPGSRFLHATAAVRTGNHRGATDQPEEPTHGLMTEPRIRSGLTEERMHVGSRARTRIG